MDNNRDQPLDESQVHNLLSELNFLNTLFQDTSFGVPFLTSQVLFVQAIATIKITNFFF